MHYRSRGSAIPEWWQVITGASQAEGICMLNETEGSAALGWVGAGEKSNFHPLLTTLP